MGKHAFILRVLNAKCTHCVVSCRKSRIRVPSRENWQWLVRLSVLPSELCAVMQYGLFWQCTSSVQKNMLFWCCCGARPGSSQWTQLILTELHNFSRATEAGFPVGRTGFAFEDNPTVGENRHMPSCKNYNLIKKLVCKAYTLSNSSHCLSV